MRTCHCHVVHVYVSHVCAGGRKVEIHDNSRRVIRNHELQVIFPSVCRYIRIPNHEDAVQDRQVGEYSMFYLIEVGKRSTRLTRVEDEETDDEGFSWAYVYGNQIRLGVVGSVHVPLGGWLIFTCHFCNQ